MAPGLEQGRRVADGFLGAVAGNPGKGTVNAQNPSAVVGDGDGFLGLEGDCRDAHQLLGLTVAGDVAESHDGADTPPGRFDRRDREKDRKACSVGTDEPFLALAPLAILEGLVDRTFGRRIGSAVGALEVEQGVLVLADDLVALPAEHGQGFRVDEGTQAPPVDAINAFTEAVEQAGTFVQRTGNATAGTVEQGTESQYAAKQHDEPGDDLGRVFGDDVAQIEAYGAVGMSA